MVQRGFKNVDEKFENLEDEVGGLDKLIFEIKLKLDNIDDRIKSIENILGPLVMVVDAMKNNWKDHEMRIVKIERKLQTK